MPDKNYALTVMLDMLLHGSRETVKTVNGAIGKTIASAEMIDDVLYLGFTDGSKIKIWDDGQSCCETRYMMTDDKPIDFIGAKLTGIELRDGPNESSPEWGEHEVQFLLVNTSLGTFTMVTHNEHNGYYGGFVIAARDV